MPGERASMHSTAGPDKNLARRESAARFSLLVTHRFSNLPIPLTGLVGRKPEIARARSLLVGASLLTLTGAGGSGKTRLALALAAEVAEEYQDGVCWVDLAGLQVSSLLWSTVGQALNLQEMPGQSFEQVLPAYLAPRRFLIILDNCEHLIDASARLAERVLGTCPHLKLLCTSREPLRITGEVAWSIPELSVPEAPFTPARIMQYDAPRLFVARARAVNPDFALTDDNAGAVAQICQRLDGMPLALELAAARARLLSVEQIAARLQDRFELLTAGSRTALPRHQTLRSTIDWSYDLLTEAERALFRRLAVFSSGFTIEAVESICIDPESRPDSVAQVASHNVVELMARLVDKSLVFVHPGDAVRYRMLETIRQYALEKLEQAHERGAISQRHVKYFTTMAEQAERKLMSAEQKAALIWLDAEHDNIAAALEWALGVDRAAAASGLGLCLASSLWRFWQVHGRPSEARVWLERVLKRTESLGRTAERARALMALGCLTWLQEDAALARRKLEAAAAIASECDERLLQADAERWLAFVLTDLGHPYEGRELLERSAWTFEAAGDRWNHAHALFVLGRVCMDLGDLDQAASFHETSLKMFRETGDRWGIALPLGHLGVIAALQGDMERARYLLEERLQLAREMSSRQLIQFASWWLGKVAYGAGQLQEAELHFRECLEVAWLAGLKVSAAEDIESLGWVARARHQLVRAARLIGAAEGLLAQVIGSPSRLDEHEPELFALRAQMSLEDFDAAWAEGAAMTWEQAIQYARQLEAETRPSARQDARSRMGGLSPREVEVAGLIAEGKSNREISAALVVSERTVTTHVANILSKLGFNSRTQVAAWAVQHGLHQEQSDA